MSTAEAQAPPARRREVMVVLPGLLLAFLIRHIPLRGRADMPPPVDESTGVAEPDVADRQLSGAFE